MSPAYIERECVTWCYCEREIEVFKVNRNYGEFVERLIGERSNNNNEYIPCIKAEIAAILDLSLIHIW